MKTSEKIKVLEKLAQYRPSGDDAANYANQAIELAVPFIKKHENYKPKAYWDKTGKKWTVGHGHTYIPDSITGKMRQVREGDTMDEAASEGLLKKIVRNNAASLYRKHKSWITRLDPYSLAALYDIAYNAGPGIFDDSKGGSPNLNKMMRKPNLNASEIFWKEVPTYRYSNHKEVEGLANRRRDAEKAWKQLAMMHEINQHKEDLNIRTNPSVVSK